MKREDIHKVSALSQADGYALAQASDAALDEFDERDDAVMRQNENWMLERFLERFAIDESPQPRPDPVDVPVDVPRCARWDRPIPLGRSVLIDLLAWLAFLMGIAIWKGWL